MARRVLTLLIATLLSAGGPAAAAQPLEQSVKAAFLAKFAHYVAWPAGLRDGNAPIHLCVIGSDPFGKLLDQAAANERGGARILVRRVGIDRTAGCHVAFVRGASDGMTQQMLSHLRSRPLLTVTDSRFGASRGMIHFAVVNGRVGFHVDDVLAQGARLQISSRLLQLALSVKGRER